MKTRNYFLRRRLRFDFRGLHFLIPVRVTRGPVLGFVLKRLAMVQTEVYTNIRLG